MINQSYQVENSITHSFLINNAKDVENLNILTYNLKILIQNL
jgi:hypothetical protein